MIMQHRSDNTFDKLLNEKFENFRSEPSAELWEKISSQLDQQPPRSRLPYAWLAAACLVIVGSYVVWFRVPSTNKVNQVVAKVATQQPSLQQSEPIAQADKPSSSFTKASISKSLSPANQEQILAAETPEQTEQVQVVAPTNSSASSIDTSKPEVLVAVADTPIPALAERATAEEQVDEEPSARRPARGLGRLVNFVVSQVDGRADKLIEVSEDPGEGLHVTGLNLGLLKLKNKTPNK